MGNMTMNLPFRGQADRRLFFFDTETTGLPRDWNAQLHPRTLNNWPRMIQLAWIFCDDNGNELSAGSTIIQPDGFVVPPDATRVHGITTEIARAKGRPLVAVLDEVLPLIEQATFAVAHNIAFDEKILGAEFMRQGRPTPFLKKPMHCTMKEATQFCAIPGHYGFKYPNLNELHKKLFGKPVTRAHDAGVDVRACKDIYFELRARGIMG